MRARRRASTLTRMPRQPRLIRGPGFFHVTCRGDRREPIYLDDRDYLRFCLTVDDVVDRYGWRCHAYCLMPNHYHLLVETRDASLSDGMRRLNTLYAQSFNRKYGYIGHVFQDRFYSDWLDGEYHALELTRYIVLNPCRAGLAADPAEWRWSSFRATVGNDPAPRFLTTEWVLGLFSSDRGRAIGAYAAFVRSAPDAYRRRRG
jgi:putative transposase